VIESKLQRAVMLHNQGQLARAQTLYEEILALQPRHFDALHLLGVIAAVTGNPRKAVDLIGRAIDIVPNDGVAHNNRGLALQELGLCEAALASFDRAASLKPGYADPHYNRGNLFRDRKQWELALTSYDRAIALRSGYAEAHCNRGIALAELERLEEALASYDRAIDIKGNYAEAHYNRGNLLCTLRRWEAALASYNRAIAVRRDYAEAHSNRAFALRELGRLDEALASSTEAVAQTPAFAAAHSNRASVLLAMNRVDEALSSYETAISLDPGTASTYVNRGMARLLAGNFEQGWADYEWRWKDTSSWIVQEKRAFSQPLWVGDVALAGRSILLHSEQGYGDTIQFCRYAKLVADLGARVILEVPEPLADLLRELAGVSQVIVRGAPLPPFDYYCPFLSLPLAMRTKTSNIPATVPYLKVHESRRRLWQERLGEHRGLRVGLVWSGGFRQDRPELWSGDGRRNVPLASLAAVMHSGMHYFSLQKGQPAESELAEFSRHWDGPVIEDLTQDIGDFADTAAFIEQLDLLISVDTATAHLAGALGKPVWILNRFDTCWRWFLGRSDSPWYPTAWLYRQEKPGDWDGVLQRVRRDLSELKKEP
jgi:tetratricopeptide (TPR) repeat protein